MRTCTTSLMIVSIVMCMGCYETLGFSGAPDGTILMTSEGLCYRISADLSKAEILAEGVACAEYSPDGERVFCMLFKESENGGRIHAVLTDRDLKPVKMIADLEVKDEDTDEGGYSLPGIVVALFMRPRWSPDGRYVSYVWPDTETEVFVLHVCTVEGEQKLEILGVSHGYSWSPDSKAVAAITGTQGASPSLGVLEVHDVETGEVTEQGAGMLFEQMLATAWGAGGEVLFSARNFEMPVSYSGFEDSGFRIYRVDTDGKDLAPVTPVEAITGEGCTFDVSADGRLIAYAVQSSSSPPQVDLYIGGTDGAGHRRIGFTWAGETAVRWLPDGRLIYGVAKENDVDVYVYAEKGKVTSDISDLIDAARATWEEEHKPAEEEKTPVDGAEVPPSPEGAAPAQPTEDAPGE